MEACNKFFSKFRPLVHIPLIIGGVILMVGLAFLFGFIVMLLWNWLMPEIFGLPAITYWQGWGMVILAHILFKSFPGGHDSDKGKKKFKKEFKEEFKKDFKKEFEAEFIEKMKKVFKNEFKKECDEEESTETGEHDVEETDGSSIEKAEESSTMNEKESEKKSE